MVCSNFLLPLFWQFLVPPIFSDMNVELFIARRLYSGKSSESTQISSPAVKIAMAGIALGLAVMIVSVCIIIGFKKQIRDKVVGFGSHIQITTFDNNLTYEHNPIASYVALEEQLKRNPAVTHVQPFITKPGIIKTETDFQGVVLKGVSAEQDWAFFETNLVKGKLITPDSSGVNQAIVSQTLANKLRLDVGDAITTYFVQEPVRARKFVIVGIYETNFEEYDNLFVVVPMDMLQTLNGWEPDMVSGLEVMVNDFDNLDAIAQHLFFELTPLKDRFGNAFYVRSIKDINPMIFNWLGLLDMNVWVIIGLMLIVSGFTMISGLLIIILERTNMIGILKSLGATNVSIRKVFLYLSAFLIARGMLWGNLIGLGLCLVQYYFQPFKLDSSIYYLSAVPIDLNLWWVLLLNVGTLIVSVVMMIGPSYLVAKITPAKSIRFE